MKEDMLVLARYKDAPEDSWFEVLLTDNQKVLEKVTRKEITRTDLLFKADKDSEEVIDMEAEWEDYKLEKFRDLLHDQALYLAFTSRPDWEDTRKLAFKTLLSMIKG